MDDTPFGSEKVITEQISESELKTYLVGFDIDDEDNRYYQLENLVNLLVDVIPEFAFGHHEGSLIKTSEIIKLTREAAKSIYKIKEFEETKKIYESGNWIADDDPRKEYLRRGEFGELILHLLLRDFHGTVPLLSKIYFKDAYGSTIHGFDAVHIHPEAKTLWLGESKLYVNCKNGIKALISDIKNHFKRDYLRDEFAIISKKIKPYENIVEKERWLKIIDEHTKLITLCQSVSIPLLCTYTSDLFTRFDDETSADFISAYENEVRELKNYFDLNNDHPLKTKLNIILLLFPVKCKNNLVKKMHERLHYLQGI